MHLVVALALSTVLAAGPSKAPVFLGLDLEFGHLTSTSDDAIKLGAQLAVADVNARGGVLGGRRLSLVERDNRSNPARGVENLRELAGLPGLVAVLGGKFSPVFMEQRPVAAELQVILLDPWAAADEVIDGQPGSWVFRLSLKDGWAMPALLARAQARGLSRVGMLLGNTAWGRSNERAARAWLAQHPAVTLAGVELFNWGDKTLAGPYQALRSAGAQAVILVANEQEGATLVKELAALPAGERLPVFSHWGITGGDFPALCGPALHQVELTVVQTFSFSGPRAARAATVLAAARAAGPLGAEALKSPVGLAHAYDLVQILARAIDLAGSDERPKVRDALERVRYEEGLVRRYGRPFTPERHEALGPEDVFLASWSAGGVLTPVARP